MLTTSITPVAFSMAAVLAWGTSDFFGGFGTRRSNAFVFTTLVNCGGLLFMALIALFAHSAFPSTRTAAWALVGGMSGGACLALFYRALSSGSMGLAAPVAAVIAAGIPALVGMITQGLPGRIALAGFALAVVGLWLVARSAGDSKSDSSSLALAALAGVGFAGFYLCIHQAGTGSPIWLASITRTGGLLSTGVVVLAQGRVRELVSGRVVWATLVGCLDSTGTMLFVLASQTGRLDEVVVLSSMYPAVTVILARIVLGEHFSVSKLIGLVAILAAVPMIAAG
jgi:uncharacterized membrane protein